VFVSERIEILAFDVFDLQNLAQCKPLRDSLLHEMPVLALAPLIPSMLSSKSGSTQLLSSFQKWMREMWSESARGPDASDTVIPNQLLMAIVQKFPSFSGKEQHDAVELFRSLLDGLSEEINALRKSSNGPAANVIADRFHGAFGSYVECQTCKAVTKRGEDFVDISLSLPQANVSSDYNQPIRCPFCSVSSANADALKVHVKQCSAALKFDPVHVAQSMQQTLTNTSTLNRLALASQPNPVPVADLLSCMEHFTAIEPLEDYRCDACTAAGRGTHQQARKCFLIAKPPPSLVIHIKRFAYSMDGSMRKIDSFMSFPEYLDMTRFCRHQNTRHAYALTGIAVHMGGMQGGHYVAYVKHSGQWHYCSDSRVRLCEIGEVMKQNAYVLFYSRVE
jgi:ubiquitin C-terminal hydrolase